MIRTKDDRQLTFILPFGEHLKPANRWIKLSSVVPWDDLKAAYNAVMNMKEGRPSKPARLVIGAMMTMPTHQHRQLRMILPLKLYLSLNPTK